MNAYERRVIEVGRHPSFFFLSRVSIKHTTFLVKKGRGNINVCDRKRRSRSVYIEARYGLYSNQLCDGIKQKPSPVRYPGGIYTSRFPEPFLSVPQKRKNNSSDDSTIV